MSSSWPNRTFTLVPTDPAAAQACANEISTAHGWAALEAAAKRARCRILKRRLPRPGRLQGLLIPEEDGTFCVLINTAIPGIDAEFVLAHELAHIFFYQVAIGREYRRRTLPRQHISEEEEFCDRVAEILTERPRPRSNTESS